MDKLNVMETSITSLKESFNKMASGILGHAALSATTNTTIYTVPASTHAVVNINVLNRSATDAVTVRLAISSTGTPGNAEYIEYDVSVPKGAGAFHLKTNTPILLGFCILCEDYKYKLSFYEMDLTNLSKDSEQAIADLNQRFTNFLEDLVKKYPEQYFWFHRKWNKSVYKNLKK